MQPHSKGEHLHIRTSEHEKTVLAMAAHASNMTVSQFVLRAAMPAAEKIVEEAQGELSTLFKLGPKEWAEFSQLLDAPARDLPELRKLLNSAPVWDK